MYQNNMPIFKKHTILKASVLQSSFLENKMFMQKLYQGYSDGIVSGSHINVTGERLEIESGVVYYQGHLYVMEDSVEIPYKPNANQQYLYLRFWEKKQDEFYEYYHTEFVLTTQKTTRANEMLFTSFLLKEGAVLRQDYQSLEDFTTIHNTLNIIDTPYASLGKPAFSPVITEFIGKQILQVYSIQPLDAAFAIECLKGQPVRYELIESYLERRLGVNVDTTWERNKVFSLLCGAMKEIKKEEQNKTPERRQRRMILD